MKIAARAEKGTVVNGGLLAIQQIKICRSGLPFVEARLSTPENI
jgi:hypothetical protein